MSSALLTSQQFGDNAESAVIEVVPAVTVDDLDWSWVECAGRDDYAQFSWSQVFDDCEVSA